MTTDEERARALLHAYAALPDDDLRAWFRRSLRVAILERDEPSYRMALTAITQPLPPGGQP